MDPVLISLRRMHWESTDKSARPVRTHGHSLIILLSGLKMASSEQQGDFLDIVQGYLGRGEIFKPVKEFVTKLTLCKRCIRGARQKYVLKDTLSRMASLILGQGQTCHSKKQEKPARMAQDRGQGPGHFPNCQPGLDQ